MQSANAVACKGGWSTWWKELARNHRGSWSGCISTSFDPGMGNYRIQTFGELEMRPDWGERLMGSILL